MAVTTKPPVEVNDQQFSEKLSRLQGSRKSPIWIELLDTETIEKEIERQRTRLADGEDLPLALRFFAVKDNIDVRGLPTTAACPDFAYVAESTAPAIQKLVDAGAVLVGKTNMDAFATGLVGTRTPYGTPTSVLDCSRISGGSSSGSAVAVAEGVVDFAIGTDTAGSGRVPAVFNGIVGLKPAKGFISTVGVVPAAESFDTLSVFAHSVSEAALVARCMADKNLKLQRCGPREQPILGVPRDEDLVHLSPEFRKSFDIAIDHAIDKGFQILPLDLSPYLGVAKLLYDGALVSERYAAIGGFLEAQPKSVDPIVQKIIQDARKISAADYVQDMRIVGQIREQFELLFEGIDGLYLPVTTEHPTLSEVEASPIEVNRRLGTYTNFANLLGASACAIPTPHEGQGGFGMMVLARGGDDQVVVDISASLLGEDSQLILSDDEVCELAVFGAHLRGMPLHCELEDLGARFTGSVRTSPKYRMVALNTVPTKPGVAVASESSKGVSLQGETYVMSPNALGKFLDQLPAPMALTKVELDDGRWTTGFSVEPSDFSQGVDISEYGGWRKFLDSKS